MFPISAIPSPWPQNVLNMSSPIIFVPATIDLFDNSIDLGR